MFALLPQGDNFSVKRVLQCKPDNSLIGRSIDSKPVLNKILNGKISNFYHVEGYEKRSDLNVIDMINKSSTGLMIIS